MAEGQRTGPVVAVFAHPDDAEIAAGGTLAKWCAAGREVHLLILTNGDRGSTDPERDRAELARIRAEEARSAAAVIGLAGLRVLDVGDGELENVTGVRSEVVREIRRIHPDTVLTCDPTAWFLEDRYYNHADHRTAGVVTLDAVFPAAGNPHYFSDQLSEGLTPHDVTDVWLSWTREPNHREDVTGFFEIKMSALAAHASQLAEGIRFFEEELEQEATRTGEEIGVRHAEPFRVLALA